MKLARLAIVGCLSIAALSACGQKARDDTGQAADSIAADTNATMTHAVEGVDAATAETADNAGRTADHAGDPISNTTDRAEDPVDTMAGMAGRATHATGRALAKAGEKPDR